MTHDTTHHNGSTSTGGGSGPAPGGAAAAGFHEVDEAELRAQVAQKMGGGDWGEIASPTSMVPDQESYPLWPGDLEGVLGAISRRTGASRSTTAAALLPAVATLTSFHYDVVTLAPRPSPTSCYCAAITESAWRKSAAAAEAWRPHWEADGVVAARHTALLREAKRLERAAAGGKRGSGGGDETEGQDPRESCPNAVRSDDTIEVIRARLAKGRPVLFQAVDEAAVCVKGFSFSGDRLYRTLGVYSTLWTGVANGEARITGGPDGGGREIFLKGGSYAFNASWLGQDAVLSPLLTSEAAALGLSGRMLVARDSVRPHVEPALPGDEDVVNLYETKVVRWRRHQDAPTIYRDWQLPARETIGMTGAARDRLYEYNVEMMTVTDSLMEDGRLAEQGAAGRAAEMAARVAGVFAAWEAWRIVPDQNGGMQIQAPSGTADKPQVEADLIEATIGLVEWYRRELRRVVDSAGSKDKVKVLAGCVKILAEAVENPLKFNGGAQTLVNNDGHISLQTILARFGPPAVRGDIDYKTEIIEALVQERYVREVQGGRGQFAVHPQIGRVVKRRRR